MNIERTGAVMKLTPFGLCVRKIRLELGLTLKGMAESVAVSSAYLSAVELGEKTLTAKLGDQVVNYLKDKIATDKLEEVRAACSQSLNMVPVSNLNVDERGLVAAFARRLSEGHGVPDDVRRWLAKGDTHNGGN